MVAGLGAFVEGASGLREWDDDNGIMGRRIASTIAPRPTSLPAQVSPTKSATMVGADPIPNGIFASPKFQHTAAHKTSTSVTGAIAAEAAFSVASSVTTPMETPPTESVRSEVSCSTRASRCADDLREQIVASNIRAAFQRAAQLVREALEIDGVSFLDATVGKYAGLVDSAKHRDSTNQSSDAATSAADNTSTETDGSVNSPRHEEKVDARPCAVMASSCGPAEDGMAQTPSDDSVVHPEVTEKFLRRMLRRYPRGKIWNFSEEGDASTDEESSEGNASRDNGEHPPKVSEKPTDDITMRRKKRKRARIDDAREIQRLFRGVRSLAVIGMWDQMRGRWFAACTVWSYSPLRVLSNELELNFLAAFNDVIMAEVHRLEAQNSDKASKSSFGRTRLAGAVMSTPLLLLNR